MPKVSIILTSYNHEKYISAAIESALNQTFSDFELLIFDDGSTDNSHKIIKSFTDPRIKSFLNEKNTGAVQMLQEGVKISKGEYIAIHHSDDIWEVDKLEKQINFLEDNPEYAACFTQAKFIDESGEIFILPENHHYKNTFNQKNRSREEWLNHLFWNGNCFCHPSILARNNPQYFVHNPFLFQLPDFFTWVNLLQKKNIYVLEDELIQFRLRSGNKNSVSSRTVKKLIRVNNEEYFVAREFLPILQDKDFFLKVFPESKKFLIDGEINTEFAFAKLCLEKKSPAFQKLALEILYNLIHNETTCKQLKKLYDYDDKNFIRDDGNFDIFNIQYTFKSFNGRLYLDYGNEFNEKNTLNQRIFIYPDDTFEAVFDFQADKKIKKFRFDPDENSVTAIKNLKISVNGENIEDFDSNAFQVENGSFYFLKSDPFFTIKKKFPAGRTLIEITGIIKTELPPDIQNIEDVIFVKANTEDEDEEKTENVEKIETDKENNKDENKDEDKDKIDKKDVVLTKEDMKEKSVVLVKNVDELPPKPKTAFEKFLDWKNKFFN